MTPRYIQTGRLLYKSLLGGAVGGTGVTVDSGPGGNSLLAGAVVGATAERHSDHAAGEGHKDGMVVPV